MKIRRFFKDAKGAAVTVTALMLVGIAGVMAVAIDLGHLYLVKNELQNAADAGANAATMGLMGINPGALSPVPISPNCSRALSACQGIVAANKADGQSLQLLTSDVSFGNWDKNQNSFASTGCSQPQQVNAVKVVVRKDLSANGAVPLVFAGLLPGGWSSKDLSAQALSLTGYVGYAPPGSGALPLAIDDNKVPPEHAREPIRIHLNPTPGDAGCWHTFDDRSPGASDLRGLVDGSIPSPALQVGDLIRVKECVSDSVLQEVDRQFTQRGGNWTVLVPVVPANSHTGWTQVLGFVALQITAVDSHGQDKYLDGITVPDYAAPGVVPGGPNFGMWAGTTKLVQ
jgi:hypothetical protein